MSTSSPSPTHLKIRTQHCRFCNHLLLATTRTLTSLPRRTGETKDNAIILPLEAKSQITAPSSTSTDKPESKTTHTTLLLSTTLPDRRATLIRREDGIEKRILLRCGRCRVVMGYYLDEVHWANKGMSSTNANTDANAEDAENENETEAERPPAVYILPGAVVETDEMGDKNGGVGEMEWRTWL